MSKLRMVLCGGGNPTTSSRSFFEAGLNLTGAEKPNILVIPTPKYTQGAHDKIVGDMTGFGRETGLNVTFLHGFGEAPTVEQTTNMLGDAHAIYITGGDTKHMMDVWIRSGIAPIIYDWVVNGIGVATGVSAGMLAWFALAHSDSLMYEVPEGEPWDYMSVPCLKLFNAFGCPHYDTSHPQTGQPRRESFHKMLAGMPVSTLGIALDNTAAMQVYGGEIRVRNTGAGEMHLLTRLADSVNVESLCHLDGAVSVDSFLR